MARFAPPTRTSPDVQTDMEKNATAVNSDRNDPMTRPCTPRCADDETALLVPLRGPNNAIGDRIVAPRIRPRRVASSASRKDKPKMMGKLPRTTVAMVLAPPKTSRNRSRGPAVRSASGIGSTPCASTSVILGGAASVGASVAMAVLSLGGVVCITLRPCPIPCKQFNRYSRASNQDLPLLQRSFWA